MKKIVIFGASGSFGHALIPCIRENEGYHITAVSRHATQCLLPSESLRAVDIDATIYSDVEALVKTADMIYCAVSGEDLPIVADNIVKAMEANGKKRLILMGAVGVYNEIPVDMDDEDNVRNNPEQVPNSEAVSIVEKSKLDYTILRPGYLVEGEEQDFVLTFKGETAKGYKSSMKSVVCLADKLIANDDLYVRQSVSITKDMTTNKR